MSQSNLNNKAFKDLMNLYSDLNREEFILSNIKITTPQAQILAEKLPQYCKLKKLDLTGLQLNNKGGMHIAKAIPASVEILILNKSFSKTAPIETLIQYLKTQCTQLKELYLLDNPISPQNIHLVEILALKDGCKITKIHISSINPPKLTLLTTSKMKNQAFEFIITEYKAPKLMTSQEKEIFAQLDSFDNISLSVDGEMNDPSIDYL